MNTSFHTLQELLAEDFNSDKDHEIRSLMSDIRRGWTSPLESIEKQTKRCWKKLMPEQQTDLCNLFSIMMEKLLAAPESPPNIKVFVPSDKEEAIAIPIGLLNLSKGLEQLAQSFIRKAQSKNETILSDADVEAAIRGNLYAMNTIAVREFAKTHGKHINDLVKCADGLPKIDIPVSLSKLLSAIAKTPPTKKREAILAVFQLLNGVTAKLNDAQQQLRTEFAGMKLKKQTSEE